MQARNPFPGPRPYEREDAGDFFGRTSEIGELRSLIASYGVVVVVGPSGCGKSSLLRAGVIPALERGEYEVLPIARLGEAARERVGAASATAIFEQNVVSYLSSPNDGSTPSAASTPLLLTTLESRPRRTASDGAPMSRVLVIDQFEELFTTNPAAWRQRSELLSAVLAANRGVADLRVVLVMRAEYLSAFAALLARLEDGSSARERVVMYFHVERLSQRAASDVIAAGFGKHFPAFKSSSATKLAQQMSREYVRGPDGALTEGEGEYVEPLYLQLICRSLWEKMAAGAVNPGDDSLIPDADIDKELRGFVATEIAAAGKVCGVRAARIRRWLEEKLITPAGTRGSVIREATETAGMPNAVVETLERGHVLRSEERSAGHWYELAHDRLVAGVQQLGTAAREHRDRQYERVVRLAVIALVLGFIGQAFWRTRTGGKATQSTQSLARETAKRANTYLAASPDVASEWIKEALAMGDDPYVDSIARVIAAQALVSRSVQRLTRTPAVAVASAPDSVVAIGIDDGRVMVFNVLNRAAAGEALGGVAAASASSAGAVMSPVDSASAAAQGGTREYEADVRGVVPGWSGGVVGMGYAARAAKLAVAGRNGRVSVVARPEWRRERDTTLTAVLTSLAVTPTAAEIAVGTTNGAIVRLPATGAGRSARSATGGRITGLAYLNERDLVAVDERGRVLGWRAGGAQLVSLWSPAPSSVIAGRMAIMALAPDGGTLMVSLGDAIHRLRFRSGRMDEVGIIDCAQLRDDPTTAIAFSRSGASLVIGSASGRMTVWGVRSGRCDWSAMGPQAEILAIAPMAVGSPVVTAASNLEVRLWFQPPTASVVRSTVQQWRQAARRLDGTRARMTPSAAAKK